MILITYKKGGYYMNSILLRLLRANFRFGRMCRCRQ